MAACLRDYPQAGIDKNYGEVGSRAARNHVAGVLFMPRSVGDNEFAVVGREVSVGHVDGDALFALGFESVEQQGIVDVVASVTHALAIALECVELVFINFLAVEKQVPD